MSAVVRRLPVEKAVNTALLGEKLLFPTSKRAANNRFLKVRNQTIFYLIE